MVLYVDPHHLVALMVQTYAKNQGGSYRSSESASLIRQGISDDHKTTLRTISVLDAISSSVRKQPGLPADNRPAFQSGQAWPV